MLNFRSELRVFCFTQRTMNKVLPTIQEIQEELNTLSEAKTLAQAQRVILSVIRLLDSSVSLDDSNQFQLFNVDNQKISANAQWFYEDNVVVDRRAIYKIHSENNLNIDFKLYGITKPSKRTISWIQALTPNFEDEPFNSKFNIGIDFVVPKSVDKVIIVLSNNYVVRTLELKGTLTATFQEILAKWAGISDFTKKKEVHSILWESFDLQPLNKKFYAGISERFITLRQYLTKEKILDDKHASLFANRLLGRVIFCWFLDKKGVINHDRKYFDSHSFTDDSEYYRKNLENLFFGVLNTPIADREYKDDVTPFLNGGLFEARDTDLYKNLKLTFPKNYFDDLFDFLSGYNFTTDESTSQFQQVAIDPEMLGRIFENLLAEMTEETGEQARKVKGAFYTPREIVDYMCRESLREYLKTKIPEDQFRDQRFVQLIDAPDKDFQDQDHNWRRDWKPYKDGIIKALDDLKVLDPACGSGAFPIGMLQLLVRVYERLEPRFDTYKAKLQIIERNIYGVDVEPMAVEIARLRAWLSIIVDEEADSKKIKPLPNLEFKFICANSLVDLDQSGVTIFGDDPELANKLQEIRDGYFNTESLVKKKKLRADYSKLVDKGEGLFGESLRSKQLKTYRPFDNEWSASFFNPSFMFGVNAFNILIGNPPYVFARNSKSKGISKEHKTYFYEHFRLAKYQINLYSLFLERSTNLLVEQGMLSFIVPNNWLTINTNKDLREFVLSFSNITIVNFYAKVFASASVDSAIILFSKSQENKNISLYEYDTDQKLNLIKKTVTDYFLSKTDAVININALKNGDIGLLVEKIENNHKQLKDLADVRAGLKAYEVGKGAPSQTEKMKEDRIYHADKKIDDSYTRYLSGRDVQRYCLSWSGEYLKYGNNLAAPRKYELFSTPRILVRQIPSKPPYSINACYSDDLILNDLNSMNIVNIKDEPFYILGVLNSKVTTFWFIHKFGKLQRGIFPQFKINELESFPIPKATDKQKNEISKLVEKVLKEKKADQSANTKIYDDELDSLVADLFLLSSDEKALINHSEEK